MRDLTLRAGLRNDLFLVRNFDLNLLRPLTADNPSTPHIASTATYIAAMKDMISRRFDVPFGVVLLPSLQQLNPDSLRRFVEHYGLQDQDLSAGRAPHALQRELALRGVTVLDVLPRLRGVSGARLHFPDDGHLTARAHAVVGEALAEWLAAGLDGGPGIMPAASPATGVSE